MNQEMLAISKDVVVVTTRIPWLTDGSSFLGRDDAGWVLAKDWWLVMKERQPGTGWECIRRSGRLLLDYVRRVVLVADAAGARIIVVDGASASDARIQIRRWLRSPGLKQFQREMQQLEMMQSCPAHSRT